MSGLSFWELLYWDDISPEKEKKIIEKTARLIEKYEMEMPALIFLRTIKPAAYAGGQFARVVMAPILPLIGDSGYDLVSFFEKKENVEKLIQEIDRIKDERDRQREEKERQEEAEKKTKSPKESKGFLNRVRRFF